VLGELVDGLLKLCQGFVLLLRVESEIPYLLLTVVKLLLQAIALSLDSVIVVGEGGVIGQSHIVLIDRLLKCVNLLLQRFIALSKLPHIGSYLCSSDDILLAEFRQQLLVSCIFVRDILLESFDFPIVVKEDQLVLLSSCQIVLGQLLHLAMQVLQLGAILLIEFF